MVHVTEYADCGELMWATRLADSEGEYECWELLSPKAVHRVSVSDKCMATIAPSGQLVLAMLGMEQQSVTLRSCRALEGITGDEGRQLWEFHLGLALNESHGQMIQALWRFYAMLPPGGLRRFSLGILRDRRFITGFYRGRASHHHHHDHVGGLLEHSVEVAMTARMLCRQYRLDGRTADVAFLGGLLHDVGKLYLYYNVEAGEGICSQHEALNFMKLEPHLQSLMSQDPGHLKPCRPACPHRLASRLSSICRRLSSRWRIDYRPKYSTGAGCLQDCPIFTGFGNRPAIRGFTSGWIDGVVVGLNRF